MTMTARQRAALVARLQALADEALGRSRHASYDRQQSAVVYKERGRAEAFRLAADLVEHFEEQEI